MSDRLAEILDRYVNYKDTLATADVRFLLEVVRHLVHERNLAADTVSTLLTEIQYNVDEQGRYDQRISVIKSLRAATKALMDLDSRLSVARAAHIDELLHMIRTEVAYAQRNLVLCFDALSSVLGDPLEIPDTEAPNIELAIVERVCADVTALRAFANDVFGDWPDGGGVDGCELQELAVDHGLLIGRMVDEPCGEECWCASEAGRDEFPLECFRRTSRLTGKPDAPQN